MAQWGYLIWYTESTKLDPIHLLKHLPKVVGFERANWVFRSDGTDERSSIELLGKEILATELYRLYVPGTWLHVDVGDAELGTRVARAIEKGVDASVRGSFVPSQSYLLVGKHFHSDDERDPPIFARPNLSVCCKGRSTPNDWDEMQRLTLSLPEITEEKQRLEHLIGTLQHAMYWVI